MQSFAFNTVNGEIYAVQVEGADELGTREQHSAGGDLELSRLSADGHAVLGHMRLEGFGHGVSIGVEPAESSVYLWTEVDSQPNSEGVGRGSRLGRFLFVDGKTLLHTDAPITKYAPVSGTQMTPSVSASEGLLTVRYLSPGGKFRLAQFRLADIERSERPQPLRETPMPNGLGTFQGYCAYGDRVYLLTGEAYTPSNQPPGNTELYCLDWSTGRTLAHVHSNMFADQVHREPEGMAIRIAPSGRPELCFGFASSMSRTDARRVISLAYIPLDGAPGTSRD